MCPDGQGPLGLQTGRGGREEEEEEKGRKEGWPGHLPARGQLHDPLLVSGKDSCGSLDPSTSQSVLYQQICHQGLLMENQKRSRESNQV